MNASAQVRSFDQPEVSNCFKHYASALFLHMLLDGSVPSMMFLVAASSGSGGNEYFYSRC